MILVEKKEKRELPGKPGEWVEIRKLGWRKLRDAMEASQRDTYSNVRLLGKDGVEAIKHVTADQIADLNADPVQRMDWGVLLRSGVTAWSQSDKRPTPEELDELDDDIAEWLVREIYTLARPPKDPEQVKNG